MPKVTMEVKGVRVLRDLVKELPAAFERDILVGSLKAGSRVIQREAKRLAPVDTGELRSSIVVIEDPKSKKRANRDPNVWINPPLVLIGFKLPVGRRAHWSEFGFTHPRAGWIPGKRFMTTAAETKTGEFYNTFVLKMRKDFVKIARRLSRRYSLLSSSDRRKLAR